MGKWGLFSSQEYCRVWIHPGPTGFISGLAYEAHCRRGIQPVGRSYQAGDLIVVGRCSGGSASTCRIRIYDVFRLLGWPEFKSIELFNSGLPKLAAPTKKVLDPNRHLELECPRGDFPSLDSWCCGRHCSQTHEISEDWPDILHRLRERFPELKRDLSGLLPSENDLVRFKPLEDTPS